MNGVWSWIVLKKIEVFDIVNQGTQTVIKNESTGINTLNFPTESDGNESVLRFEYTSTVPKRSNLLQWVILKLK